MKLSIIVPLKEKWKRVRGFPFYKISNFGRIKSLDKIVNSKNDSSALKRGKFLKLKPTIHGYFRVKLYKEKQKWKRFGIHQLVIKHFGSKQLSPKHEPNHKDGDKTNNHISNLEWVTRSENSKHAYKMGLTNPSLNFPNTSGENNPRCKLSKLKVMKIRIILKYKRKTQREIAEDYNVTRQLITAINNKRIWKEI